MLHASQPYVAPTLRNGVPGEGSGPSFRPPILGRVTMSKPRVVAGFGRRILALLVDWLIAYGLAGFALVFGWLTPAMLSTAVLIIWFVLGAIFVRLFSFTPGQFALGLMVVSVDDRLHVGIGRAAVRGLLVALVVPPLFVDSDGNGLQDRVTLTSVVRR